jgi:hypothetical protein
MAQALSMGSGITSGQAMNAPSIRELFKLQEHEEGICYVAFGQVHAHKPQRPRLSESTRVTSLN